MKKAGDDKPKRPRGRPPTLEGERPVISGKVPKETLDAVDRWANANQISRSEAVAELLRLGLMAAAKKRRR
jgi:metal-responsive CopG/Arc/MetJ family transcriptional regulator